MTAAVKALPVHKAPKHIEVNGHKIRLRFAQQIAWSVIFGTLALAAVAAVYYLLFETRYVIAGHQVVYLKPWWDSLGDRFVGSVHWVIYRHGLRDILEGVFGKFLVQSLVAKWSKHPDQRLSWHQMLARGITLVILAVILSLAGVWLLSYGFPHIWHHAFGHHHVSVTDSTGFLSEYDWPYLITGFIVGHILRAQWRPIGSTISLNFIEKAVTRSRETGRVPLWVKLPLMPPTVRERFSWIMDEKLDCRDHGPWPGRFAYAAVAVFIALAGYGEYILQWVAKGR